MKKYFLYELKKSLIPFLIIAFAGIILYPVPLSLERGQFHYYELYYIGYLMLVLGIACAIMPVWIFSYKMKRRSTDLYYSLPMTRTKQLTVRYIVGFIDIIAAYTVAYLLGFIITVIKFGSELNLIYYLPLYFASIIPAYIIYSMASFAFTRANSVIDGIFFIIYAAIALFLVTLFISEFTKYKINYTDPNNYVYYLNYIYSSRFFPFTMLDEVTSVFQGLIYGYSLNDISPFADMSDPLAINIAVSFALYALISVACTAGLFMTEHSRKAENCNQVSESIFGYKTMLPLSIMVVCSIFGIDWLTTSADTIMLLAIAIAAIYVISALYKKSFKIGWKFAIVLLIAAVIGLICGTISGGLF